MVEGGEKGWAYLLRYGGLNTRLGGHEATCDLTGHVCVHCLMCRGKKGHFGVASLQHFYLIGQ